jgi:hypothetical protein
MIGRTHLYVQLVQRALVSSRLRRGEADPAEKVVEARIASQRVESGIHPDKGHSIRTREVPFFQPRESPLFIAQCGVHTGYIETADVSHSCLRLDCR